VFEKLLIAIAALGCLGFAGFGVLAWRPAIAAAEASHRNLSPGRGTRRRGLCAACHTAKDGERFAGGYGMATRSAPISRPIRQEVIDALISASRSGDATREL
jgi:hypothetical protein